MRFFLPLWLVCLITGFTSLAIELKRLGSYYGGWTIPVNLLHENSICYCVGAGEDITFDIELIRNFGCNVYCIDPTPRAIEHITALKNSLTTGERIVTTPANIPYNITEAILKKFTFLPVGLWSENKIMKFYSPKNPQHVSHSIINLQQTDDFFEAPCKRLSSLMKELGHSTIDLLKLDIEGAEGVILKNIIEDKLNISCICVEFDEAKHGSLSVKQRVEQQIKTLEQYGYTIIYRRNFDEIIFLKDGKT